MKRRTLAVAVFAAALMNGSAALIVYALLPPSPSRHRVLAYGGGTAVAVGLAGIAVLWIRARKYHAAPPAARIERSSAASPEVRSTIIFEDRRAAADTAARGRQPPPADNRDG